jgi:hypothetical protein
VRRRRAKVKGFGNCSGSEEEGTNEFTDKHGGPSVSASHHRPGRRRRAPAFKSA